MDLINFDNVGQQEHLRNENDDQCMPKWPFRMLMIGSSGSGKTNLMLNMIMTMLKFDRLLVFAADIHEHKYQVLEKWCGLMAEERREEKNEPPFIYLFSSELEDVPSPDAFEEDYKDVATLIIFDDMVTKSEKEQKVISELFIRGRKKNISSIYLTQRFTSVPKTIRAQATCCIIFHTDHEREIMNIANNLSGKWSYKDLQSIMNVLGMMDHEYLVYDSSKPLIEQWRIGLGDEMYLKTS